MCFRSWQYQVRIKHGQASQGSTLISPWTARNRTNMPSAHSALVGSASALPRFRERLYDQSWSRDRLRCGFNSPTQCEPPHPSLARSGPVRRGRPGHLRRRAPLSTELSYAADCLKAEIYRRLLGSSGRLAWSLAPAGHFSDASHGFLRPLTTHSPLVRHPISLHGR
jgi:hypothetical protein